MNENQVSKRIESDVKQQVGGPGDQFVERLAEQLGGKASVAAVFGTPVERDGVTVIPVAKARWGFGGGTGRGTSNDNSGSEGSGAGGGGGVAVSPLGYIELKAGNAQFRRINDPSALIAVAPVVLAAAFSIALILRSVRRILTR